ncbi:DNA polymerase alpha/epsilon subunit B-domain-containing protein [Cubamyces menziesii]|nr:DNA polymerase alpha/epsilon subunit B-domain-containing protein [Cubamyces menziesii]
MTVADPIPVPSTPLTRPGTTAVSPPEHASFIIKAVDKSYRHQYANIYFVRLRELRQHVEQRAKKRWNEVAGNPVFVPRVLDVEKGKLCFIIGTVYMDMPLKPNVLEDVARDRSIPAPPPREKYYSDNDSVMLEDESGRICLVGDRIRSACLVTGVILGALGIETHNGDFEVVDLCYPGMAPQPSLGVPWSPREGSDNAMEVDDSLHSLPSDEWIALVSGLDVGAASPADGQLQLLAEFLTAEVGGTEDQSQAARISRLIIAGNSLGTLSGNAGTTNADSERKPRRYGQDTSSFTPHPTQNLAAHLTDVCRSMPVHLLPGPSDPAATILPQQPIPRAMFGEASRYATFSCESNPTFIHIAPAESSAQSASRGSQPGASSSKAKTNGKAATHPQGGPMRSILVHSGQPLDDMFKYVPTPPISRMTLAEATLRWRHMAPTAPDTLWCHPYFRQDPFLLLQTPDLYVVGNQPKFATKLVQDTEAEENEQPRKRCRIVLLPGFRETGILVLVNLRTLAVRKIQFAVEGMNAGGAET